MSDIYFPPQEIVFSQEQIIWLLSVLPMLRSGAYPPEPSQSGYTDAPTGKKQIKPRAPFVIAAETAAELDSRLTQAGLDGLLLELVYGGDNQDRLFMIQHIAIALGTDIKDIDRRLEKVLKYISGWRRKERGFTQWKRHKRGKEKGGGG